MVTIWLHPNQDVLNFLQPEERVKLAGVILKREGVGNGYFICNHVLTSLAAYWALIRPSSVAEWTATVDYRQGLSVRLTDTTSDRDQQVEIPGFDGLRSLYDRRPL
jgi:hypothetical protein